MDGEEENQSFAFEVLVKNPTGKVIGTALLKPTENEGIYSVYLTLDQKIEFGLIHLPIHAGDTINTMTIKGH